MSKTKNSSLFILFLITIIVLMPNMSWAANAVPSSVMQSSKSVLRVVADYGEEISSGSSFIIDKSSSSTYVATNYHVVADNPDYIYVIDGNGELIDAIIYGYNINKDVAILKLDAIVNEIALNLNPNGVSKGDAIYAVGFPAAADDLGVEFAYSNNDVTITDGIVSSIKSGYTMEGANVDVLQVSAAINPGNSGGPLFNSSGEVVGINTYTSATENVQGIYWAISIQEVIDIINTYDLAYVESSPSEIYIFVAIGVLLIIILVVFTQRNKKNNSTITVSCSPVSAVKTANVNEIRCPECNAVAPIGAKFCKICGYKFETINTINKGKARFCRKCGSSLEEGARFCRKCGSKIELEDKT